MAQSFRVKAGAQGTILVVVASTVGVVYVARLAAGPGDVLTRPGQMIRIAIGGSVILFALMLTAEASPEMARAVAWLIFLGTVIGYGTSLGGIVARLISGALGASDVHGTIRIETDASPSQQNLAGRNVPLAVSTGVPLHASPLTPWEIINTGG